VRRAAAVAAAVALALGASACRGADESPDYSDLTRLAARVNDVVGKPPGVAEVRARGGSMGDGGYFVIDVLLDADATADQVLDLLRVRLPRAAAAAKGGLGAPLTLRTPDGDVLGPDWGRYADLAAEEPAIRSWVTAETALDAPVTGQVGSVSAFEVDLGAGAPGEIARTARVLQPLSPDDLGWDLTASADGTALRLASKHGAPDDASLAVWRSLVDSCRAPAGGFACSGLGLGIAGSWPYVGSLVLRVPPSVEPEQLTPATYGSALVPIFTAQASALKRSSAWRYDVAWSRGAGLVPPLQTWPRAGPSDAVQPSPLFELSSPPEADANPWAVAVRAALRR
jgi:hypothetical protein